MEEDRRVSDRKIIRIGTSDNFWQMGDTGPCGPCSEIFFDHGDPHLGRTARARRKDAIGWNLVFMQYERTFAELPKPVIGSMGLERIAAVLQGVHDNYDIDLAAEGLGRCDRRGGAEGDARSSHRVIADHLRAMSFLIADGVAAVERRIAAMSCGASWRGMRHSSARRAIR